MDGNNEEGDGNDGEAHVHDAIVGLDGSRSEKRGHADRGARITSSTDVARSNTKGAAGDVRNNAV